MSDEADIANDQIELSRMAAIEACRHQLGLIPKGSCWYCDEPLAVGHKFCNKDCASDYEYEEAALARLGRRRSVDMHAD